jgi:hypothetical protein
VALWHCTLKDLRLPSYLSQLLVKPLSILVLSPEYTLLVAPTLPSSRHGGLNIKLKPCARASHRFHTVTTTQFK